MQPLYRLYNFVQELLFPLNHISSSLHLITHNARIASLLFGYHNMNEHLKNLAEKFSFNTEYIAKANPNFELMLKALVMECANMAQGESREEILRHFGLEETQPKKLVPFTDFLSDLTPVRGNNRPIQLDTNHEHHQISENDSDDNDTPFPAYHFTPEAYELIDNVTHQFVDELGRREKHTEIDDRLLEICIEKTVRKCIELKQNNNMSDNSLKSYFWDKE